MPLAYVGKLPRRVMAFEIAGQQRREAVAHPLLNFFRHTRDPDIDIGTGSSVRACRARCLRRRGAAGWTCSWLNCQILHDGTKFKLYPCVKDTGPVSSAGPAGLTHLDPANAHTVV